MHSKGLYFARVIGTNVFPNEPVPPVTKIVELVNISSPSSIIFKPISLHSYIRDIALTNIINHPLFLRH